MSIFSIGAMGLLAKYGHVQVIFKDLSDRRSVRMSTMLGNYAILFVNRLQKNEALNSVVFFMFYICCLSLVPTSNGVRIKI